MRRRCMTWKMLALSLAVVTSLGSSVPAFAGQAGDANGTFEKQLEAIYKSPAQTSKTEARWWFPEGGLTDDVIKEEIESMHKQGFTGFELCQLENPGVDSNTYAYGSEEWAHDAKYAIELAAKYNMSVGLTSGTHWHDANIPGLDANSNAAGQEAAIAIERVAAGQPRSGALKAPDDIRNIDNSKVTKKLIGVYAYKIAKKASGEKPSAQDPETLDQSKVVDLTAEVKDGTLDWTAPSDGDYELYTIWQRGTWQAENPSQKQAYAINYYDEDGVNALKTYLDSYLFSDPEFVNTVKKAGNVQFFLDSLEINTNSGRSLYWSDDMAEEFQKIKGYDIRPYLPLFLGEVMFQAADTVDSTPNGNYILSDSGTETGLELTAKIKNDFYDVQTQLFQSQMLKPLKAWASQYNIKVRAQMPYGTFMENSEPGMSMDYVETETLNMKDQTDLYRKWSGAAHIVNTEYSSETACVFGMNYALDEQDYVKIANLEFAGGVNRVIWHGHASQWGPTEELSAWPGYEGMGAGLSTRLDSREPLSLDYDEMNDYFGRVQTLLREGHSATDLGILYMGYGLGTAWPMEDADYIEEHKGFVWKDTGLQDAGYTYDYFSPDYLNVMNYDGTSGTLGSTVNYKAVLLMQKMMPVDAAKRLLTLAQQGLKVIIVGDAASETPYASEKESDLKDVMDQVKALGNVKVVAKESDAKAALESMNVRPRAAFDNTQILTQVRTDGSNEYLYVYNYCDGTKCGEKHGTTADTDITVEGSYVPYEIDPWSGDVTRIADYRNENGNTIIHVDLDYNENALYAFEKAQDTNVHAVASDAEKVSYGKNGELTVSASKSGTYTTKLSDGKTATTQINVPEQIDLTNGKWDLTVEDWQKGNLVTDSETRNTEVYVPETDNFEKKAVTTTNYKYDTTKNPIKVQLNGLKTWDQISEVGRNVSGTGTYKTTFNWRANKGTGAVLDLGSYQESAKVWVNGQKAEAFSQVRPVVDITPLLKDGENTLEIRVTTSLFNRLVAMGLAQEADSVRFNSFSKHVEKNGLSTAVLKPYVTEDVLRGTGTPTGEQGENNANTQNGNTQNAQNGNTQNAQNGNTQNGNNQNGNAQNINAWNTNAQSSSSSETGKTTAAEKTSFSDVSASAYYSKAVNWAVQKGITAGFKDGKFHPADPCTRAQMVTFLYRLAGSPKVTGSVKFTDVDANGFYYDALVWASQQGIAQGSTNGKFNPNAVCTRGQMAEFLYRLKATPKVSGTHGFTDVQSTDYYNTAVTWLKQTGITSGKTSTEYKPNENCTRGEMVTFLYNYSQVK